MPLLIFALLAASTSAAPVVPNKGSRIVLLGSGLGDRMNDYGHFETEVQLRYPDHNLVIRNMCHPGFTPGFRPHPSRKSQWACPGAEEFRPGNKIHSRSGTTRSPTNGSECSRRT